MDYLAHVRNRNETLAASVEAVRLLQHLSLTLSGTTSPTSGPHLVLHFILNAIERCRQSAVLLKRLHDNRVELLKSDVVENALVQTHGPSVLSTNEYTGLILKSRELDEGILLDFECLLLFSGILLDDWAQISAHVLGKDRPERFSFHLLAEGKGIQPFDDLWNELHKDILWLDAIPRLFRNKFIVHKEQPWQTGHARSIFQLDWRFSAPIAAGWLDQSVIDDRKKVLIALLSSKGIEAEDDNALVLTALNNIAEFDSNARSSITSIAKEIGFETPTFQHFGFRLMNFVVKATKLLNKSAERNPSLINMGSRVS